MRALTANAVVDSTIERVDELAHSGCITPELRIVSCVKSNQPPDLRILATKENQTITISLNPDIGADETEFDSVRSESLGEQSTLALPNVTHSTQHDLCVRSARRLGPPADLTRQKHKHRHQGSEKR